MLYDSKDLPVRVIALDEDTFDAAKRQISSAAMFTDVHWWKAIRGKNLFDDAMRVRTNYSEIIAANNPEATLPRHSALLSTQAQITLSTGVRTNIYDLHNPGAVGCSLSHISLWQHMVDHQIAAMIVFEDDVQFLEAFRNGHRDLRTELNTFLATFGLNFDILNLNVFPIPKLLVHSTILTPSALMDNVCHLRGVAFRAQGYIITLAGAKKLLNNALPLIHTIDAYMTMPTIVPTMQENFIYLAMQPVLLHHPSLDLCNSSIGYGLTECLMDSILFLPRIVIFAVIGICILSLVATIVLTVAALKLWHRQKQEKSLNAQRIVTQSIK